MRHGAAGNGALLHGFEQRGLGLRRGAVDFVGQNEMGEDRPGLKAQHLVAVVVRFHDHAADDIGGHQVGGELDARVAQAEGAREGAQQRGLAQARDAFQQHMSAAEQADQNAIHHALLAYDDFRDLVAYLI